ncbi:nucleolar complex protein 4 homolog A-like isoform X2 [Varroa jacobsoni]|uniref:nucleolar complex protein 4 homolog A-like isoform X2 n=1 Tax=Varroa jacobsoni TaxID=62625 RepID=UPI000BF549B7|nr:nucleolar complex protein 4 homolog A-like isoform X2 [Varroa jacobsoni]
MKMNVLQETLEKNVSDFMADHSEIECAKAVVNGLKSKTDQQLIPLIVQTNKIFSQVFLSEQNFFSPTFEAPLKTVFAAAWANLLDILAESRISADLALQTLLKWLEIETIKGSNDELYVFPECRLENLLVVLCGGNANMSRHTDKLVNKMQAFDDLNYYVCKALSRISEKFAKPTTDQAIWNYFGIIKAVRVRNKVSGDKVLPAFGGLENFPFDYKKLQTYYQYAWINFLRASLPEKMYIHVLVLLDDKKVSLFKNPCLLADFLIESYNKGGAVALLALNGLFTLIHKYNLELPDFYSRLYALFRAEVFYTKYRARFFFLADVFLTSTHLPAYLVAAFAKKMSRLCLTAPAYSQMHVIPFIGNLIIRHATLGRMVHCEDVKDLSVDPFIETETDPAKSRALESSLWELKTLQSHWFHRAAAKARIIDNPFPKIEWDLSDVLEADYPQLFEQAVKEKYKGVVPINYHKPKGLLQHADDRMSTTWILE